MAWLPIMIWTMAALAEPAEVPGDHHREAPNLLGVKAGALGRAVDMRARPVVLGFVERVVVHRWLEVELEVPVMWTPSGDVELAIDVHFKKPFHPSMAWSPYVGIGPLVELGSVSRPEPELGLSFVTGTYVWPSSRFGLDLDLGLDVVFREKRPVLAWLLSVGPVWRF